VKAEELGALIFDHDLSPSQQRNWEELSGVPVLDRQKVILDIFGGRARSREARLQIELAQIEYSLPRLTRAWAHLGGQGGGIGGKGEGESQLEQDRRRMWKASDRLKRELEQIKSARATQRKDRQRTPVPNCAIVGYTNVGKSSLLHRLTGADVLVENKLFATLDTTTRKVSLPSKQPLLLTDTVGFVRKLPHRLVEAFKATLEEAAQADFLVHLLDASAPEVMEFYATTMKVLAELGADKRPMIVVFNKTDKVSDIARLHGLRTHFPDALFISVQTGEGLDVLLEKMSELASPGTLTRNLRIPAGEAGLVARIYREARVHQISYDGADTLITATLAGRLTRDCARFMQSDETPRDSASAMAHAKATRRRKTGGFRQKKA
jgi:GTP-binding protein HflX